MIVSATASTYSIFNYQIKYGQVTITGVECSYADHITIPSVIDGYPVTTIGEYAFASTLFTGVTIPEGVTKIKFSAFEGAKLETVTLPKTLENIQACAFFGCRELTSITIPQSVNEIGWFDADFDYWGYMDGNVFAGCDKLEAVYFLGDLPPKFWRSFDGVDTTIWYHAGSEGWDTIDNKLTSYCTATFQEAPHICSGYTYDNNHTCTVNGTERGVCQSCGELYIRIAEGTAAHRFKTSSNGDATCTQDGTNTKICMLCAMTEIVPDPGSATGHAWSEYVPTGDATCLLDGTLTSTCANCGLKKTQPGIGSALGHAWSEYIPNGDATCTADGTKTAVCGNCGMLDIVDDIGSATGHTWTGHVFNDDATCTADGTQTVICRSCHLQGRVIAHGSAIGHSFTQYVYQNNHTCTTDGTEMAKCDRCEATDWRFVAGTAAHRYYDGECIYCGIADDYCSSFGHAWSAYVPDGNATCTADGTKTAVCGNCGLMDIVNDIGTATGHDWSAYISNGDATCTADGTKTAVCSLCHMKDQITETGTALGHHYDTETTPPTCTEDGFVITACAVCGDSQTEVIPATGHHFEGYTCTLCGQRNGVTLSGTITSFDAADGAVIVRLMQGEVEAANGVSTNGTYCLEAVAPGDYTLVISKLNHVTRTCSLTLADQDVTQDVKLHLIGDVNGDGRVNTGDVSKMYAHAKKSSTLEGYEFACADINGDGRVNTGDTSKAYAHAKKTALLW